MGLGKTQTHSKRQQQQQQACCCYCAAGRPAQLAGGGGPGRRRRSGGPGERERGREIEKGREERKEKKRKEEESGEGEEEEEGEERKKREGRWCPSRRRLAGGTWPAARWRAATSGRGRGVIHAPGLKQRRGRRLRERESRERGSLERERVWKSEREKEEGRGFYRGEREEEAVEWVWRLGEIAGRRWKNGEEKKGKRIFKINLILF